MRAVTIYRNATRLGKGGLDLAGSRDYEGRHEFGAVGDHAMLRVLAAMLVAAGIHGAAVAQDISGKAKEAAEALAGQGKLIEALGVLDEAATALWERAPLTMRRALWVAETPNGFGAYNPRESNVFTAGTSMIAYAEPVGFGWRKSGDLWYTDLIVDLVIKATDGTVLLRKAEFQKLELGSRVRNHEFMAHFTYTFTGIPAGEYVVETTLRDAVSGKSGTFSLPFVIR
jgi:hypothetical protein